MKNLIFLMLLMATTVTLSAQVDSTKFLGSDTRTTTQIDNDDGMRFLPPFIEWNMHRGGGTDVDLLMKNPTELERLGEEKYWVEPAEDKKSMDMYITSPKDHGYGSNYRHAEFVNKVLNMGYSACPVWLPLQAYLVLPYQNKPVKFYVAIEETVMKNGKTHFFAVGPTNNKVHDLFLSPLVSGDYRAQWVFVKYHDK